MTFLIFAYNRAIVFACKCSVAYKLYGHRCFPVFNRYQETVKPIQMSLTLSPQKVWFLKVGLIPYALPLWLTQKASWMGPGPVHSLQGVSWLLPALVMVPSPMKNCDMLILGSHNLRY